MGTINRKSMISNMNMNGYVNSVTEDANIKLEILKQIRTFLVVLNNQQYVVAPVMQNVGRGSR